MEAFIYKHFRTIRLFNKVDEYQEKFAQDKIIPTEISENLIVKERLQALSPLYNALPHAKYQRTPSPSIQARHGRILLRGTQAS